MPRFPQTEIRCITFDLDDTLWACAPVIVKAEARFYAWLQQHYPAVSEAFSADDLRARRMEHMRDNPQLAHHLTRLRKHWLGGLRRAFRLDERFVEEGFEVYWRARNEVDVFDEVEPLLSLLKPHYTIGAMTNGNADVHTIGIGHLFDFVVTSMESGAAKPHPAPFQQAAEKSGIPLAQTLHVGDDWRSDVLGAVNAGAWAAWLKKKGEDEPPHTEMKRFADRITPITSLTELEPLLLP